MVSLAWLNVYTFCLGIWSYLSQPVGITGKKASSLKLSTSCAKNALVGSHLLSDVDPCSSWRSAACPSHVSKGSMTDDIVTRTILTSQKSDQFPVAVTAWWIWGLRGEERGEPRGTDSRTLADVGKNPCRGALAVVGDDTWATVHTWSHCFLFFSVWTLLRWSYFSTPSVDSAPVAMVSIVSVKPVTCETCVVPTTPVTSTGMLRDTSVIEDCTAPELRSADAADRGGTDSPVCTAAHEDTTTSEVSLFTWIREPTDRRFPFPLPPSTNFQGSTKKNLNLNLDEVRLL